MATYIGHVMVDPTPEEYNKRWGTDETDRCSPVLPYADGWLGFKVSNTVDNPAFTLTLDASYLPDTVHLGRDVQSGFIFNLWQNAHQIYAHDIKLTTSPFFLHLFKLAGPDDSKMELPEEFRPK